MRPKADLASIDFIKPEEIDFQQYWFILKRRWLLATGTLVGSLALVAVASLLLKPVYQASGKLLVKADRTASLTGVGLQENDKELAPLTQQGNPLKTEVEIILSGPVLKKTITELNLKDKQGEPLAEESLKQQLTVKNIAGADVLEVSYKGAKPQEAAAVVNKLMSLYIENNILTNRGEAVAARKFIAKQLPETEVTVRQAEMALRSFKERNNVVNLELESKSALEATENLENEINKTQFELENSTAKTEGLQTQLGMNTRQALAASSLSQSSGVQEALKEFQQVDGQLAQERIRFQEQNPTIQDLKDKREALKALLQERVQQTLAGQEPAPDGGGQTSTPTVKQKLTEDLAQSETERLGLARQLASLRDKHSIYQQQTKKLPKLEQEQQDLARRVAAAQATYETLLKNLQQTQVVENQNIGNARIIEPAVVPRKPSSGKQPIVLALGCVMSILLAGGTVIILEVKDRSIKNVKQAKDLFGYTLLGSIPMWGKVRRVSTYPRDLEQSPTKIAVRDDPRSPISEMYRMLQANLRFISPDKELKVIVVTSSVPKEGKSSVCANLAVAKAQLGHKVLLIDADIRRPSQHHIWELSNAVGLSDVIFERTELRTAVKKVIHDLDVLTSGATPPNPAALIDSKRLASLIENLSETYNFVIIDAPPLTLAADALNLGKMADGVLLVARPGVLDFTSAAAAKESLQRSNQNVLGLVINGVIVENESDSYFYYSKEYQAQETSGMREKAR